MNIFKRIRLLDQRHETTRLLISDLEMRYLRLLREMQELQDKNK